MLLMRAASITWEIEIFLALRNGMEPMGECHLGPTNFEISQGPTPSHLPK